MLLNFLHIIIEDDQIQMFVILIQIVIHLNELHLYFDIDDIHLIIHHIFFVNLVQVVYVDHVQL
jgi:hypothetical protein